MAGVKIIYMYNKNIVSVRPYISFAIKSQHGVYTKTRALYAVHLHIPPC